MDTQTTSSRLQEYAGYSFEYLSLPSCDVLSDPDHFEQSLGLPVRHLQSGTNKYSNKFSMWKKQKWFIISSAAAHDSFHHHEKVFRSLRKASSIPVDRPIWTRPHPLPYMTMPEANKSLTRNIFNSAFRKRDCVESTHHLLAK